jgi:membrane-associated phospholipid phosphatase
MCGGGRPPFSLSCQGEGGSGGDGTRAREYGTYCGRILLKHPSHLYFRPAAGRAEYDRIVVWDTGRQFPNDHSAFGFASLAFPWRVRGGPALRSR